MQGVLLKQTTPNSMLHFTHVNNLEVSESHSKYMTKWAMQLTHNQWQPLQHCADGAQGIHLDLTGPVSRDRQLCYLPTFHLQTFFNRYFTKWMYEKNAKEFWTKLPGSFLFPSWYFRRTEVWLRAHLLWNLLGGFDGNTNTKPSSISTNIRKKMRTLCLIKGLQPIAQGQEDRML